MIERTLKIKAPLQMVFDVVSDFSSYPEFLETTKAVHVRKTTSHFEVDFEVNVIKTIRYTLDIAEKAPHELRWQLIRGDLMKSNSGAWILKAIDDETTEARYQIDIGFGWMVPKAIVDQVTKTQLPDTLKAFKERAESLFHKATKKAKRL